MEYLIKWEGFGDDWNSWLNEEDVWCKELIEEYNSGKIRMTPSRKAILNKKRMMHKVAWEMNGGADDWYTGAKRKAAAMASRGGGKGNLFASMGALEGGAMWDLDVEMDEDLWRDTWDNGSSAQMSEDDDEDDEDEYEEVPVTKEEKEKQQREFLRSLDANPHYKPVILFFEKS